MARGSALPEHGGRLEAATARGQRGRTGRPRQGETAARPGVPSGRGRRVAAEATPRTFVKCPWAARTRTVSWNRASPQWTSTTKKRSEAAGREDAIVAGTSRNDMRCAASMKSATKRASAEPRFGKYDVPMYMIHALFGVRDPFKATA